MELNSPFFYKSCTHLYYFICPVSTWNVYLWICTHTTCVSVAPSIGLDMEHLEEEEQFATRHAAALTNQWLAPCLRNPTHSALFHTCAIGCTEQSISDKGVTPCTTCSRADDERRVEKERSINYVDQITQWQVQGKWILSCRVVNVKYR